MADKKSPEETAKMFDAMTKAFVKGKPTSMNHNKAEIIVFGPLLNEQKQVVLSRDRLSTTIYNITIDKEYHGQAIRMSNGWGVYPIEGSSLKGENCDFIIQAILNTETTN